MFVSKKLSYVLVAMCAMFLSVGTMLAQNINVTGKVTDKTGEPIVGAYILIEGTQTGATTDIDGVYKLSAPAKGTLVFSCVGYKEHKAAVNSRASINITLEDDSMLLENAVVVGFGTQKKENLTGAVASVNTKQALESRPITDVGRALQGTTPGLSVTVTSTEIGSDPKLRIRGQVGSYEGSSAPLILLDNVEIPSLSLVNPDDIESISVLKDAASASIYGAKGAFGVILITSKKGAATESVKVTYSGNVAFQNPDARYQQGDVDALHYQVLAAETQNTFTPVGGFWLVDRAGWQAAVAWKAKYGKNGTTPLDINSPLTYGRDWYLDSNNRKIGVRTYDAYDYLVREWAPTQNHNVSVAGKVGKTDFNIGLGYLGQQGMLSVGTDYYSRYNANVRVSTQINKFLTVRASMMYSNTKKSYTYIPGFNGTTSTFGWSDVYRWNSNNPAVAVDEFGTYLRNAAGEAAQANTASKTNSYASVTAGATVTPLKNWDINVDYTYARNENVNLYPGYSPIGADNWYETPPKVSNGAGGYVMVANEWSEFNGLGANIEQVKFTPTQYYGISSGYNSIERSAYATVRQTWNANTTYKLDIAENNHFNFMLGMQSISYEYDGQWGKRTMLMDYSNPQFDLATGTQTVGGSYDWDSVLGFYGRINYNYKERYLVEANIRYDGSSKFPTSMQWKWYPSFSGGWRVSEEPWMQGAKNVLSSWKLRASWGSIGDQSVSNSLYIPTLSRAEASWLLDGSKAVYYKSPAAVANGLTWQDIVTLDFGTDIRLFNSLGITFDWFQRDTKNMIVGAEGIGINFGTSAPKGNYGSLRTRGWEVALDWGHVFASGFSLSVNASLADATTIVTKYGDAATAISGWYNGKTYGEIWGYKTDGLFTSADFAHDASGNLIVVTAEEAKIATGGAYPYAHYKFADGTNYPLQDRISGGGTYTKFREGDVRYKDLDGDGYITPGTSSINDHGDLTVIGNTTPRYEYSFRVDMAWKGFDLGIFFQGVGKREMWSDEKSAIPTSGSDGWMPQAIAGNFWYEEFDGNGNVIDSNYDAYFARPRYSSMNYNCNDRYLLNLAYLRLKNLTFGYTIPQKATRKAYIDRLRVYVSLENFLTFNHLDGRPIDVEGAISGSPAFKTASAGLQLTF